VYWKTLRKAFSLSRRKLEIVLWSGAKISTFIAGLNEILNVLIYGLIKRFNLIFKFLSCAGAYFFSLQKY
jgi:hypothetical protein